MPLLEAGQLFERYRIMRGLGNGVSGESYEAEDTVLLRKVTLKLVHPWTMLSDAARRQFFREMQVISMFTHPYLAAVLDYGEIDGRLYIARRYVSSGSLLGSEGRSWFRSPMPIPDAIQYGHQLAEALYSIHTHGYVHGALTLSNILVLRGSNIEQEPDHAPFLLADVGLAHFVRRFGQVQTTQLPITAAPEQLGQRITPASDQFALAVLLYLWLTGRPPYLGSPEEVEQLKLTETIPPFSAFHAQATVEQEAIVRRALSVYPEERYRDILAFVDALQATLTARTITTPLPKLELPVEADLIATPQFAPEAVMQTTAPLLDQPHAEPEPEHELALLPQDQLPFENGEEVLSYEEQPAEDLEVVLTKEEAISLSEELPAEDVEEILTRQEAISLNGESPAEGVEAVLIHEEVTSIREEPSTENGEKVLAEEEVVLHTEELQPIPLARLIITSPQTEELTEVLIERDVTTLGRAGFSDILLDQDNLTSRHQALLKHEGDSYVLYDRRSANGTFVNGQMLVEDIGYTLEDGDHISIGNYELIFRLSSGQARDEDRRVTPTSDAFLGEYLQLPNEEQVHGKIF